MSFNRLPTLEAQPTQYRDEPETQADTEFDKFSEDLSTKVGTPSLTRTFSVLTVPAFFPHSEHRSIVTAGEFTWHQARYGTSSRTRS
jgi:hypothetical protein